MTGNFNKEIAHATVSSMSAVFPAYNDGGTIASVVAAASIALKQVVEDYEIVVVNDGSSDHTAAILDETSSRYPELRVITHPANQGYGAALRSGFSAATKDWIFYTDGDSQYNPLELVHLVKALHDNVDVVNGYKINRNDSWIRVVIGRAYHYFVKFLFDIHIRDVDCDFRLIPRRILEEIELKSNSGAICLELVKKIEDAGYAIAEVPVSHYSRKYGVSQFFVPWRILRTLRQLADLYWMLVIRKEHLQKNKTK
ncbi:MAG: glycosyltransferase family 2 protein [Anaerolineales bacterium]|nr:glycosyltransferase family 2 protein [Anaerolineales bacterium]